MNHANLNRVSFGHYLKYCVENQLVMTTSGGYVTTPRAEELLQRLEQVLQREAELRIAVEGLQQMARSGAFRAQPSSLNGNSFNRVAPPSLGIELLTARSRDRDRERERR